LFTVLDAYPQPGIEDMVLRLAIISPTGVIEESDKPFTAFEAAGRLWE